MTIWHCRSELKNVDSSGVLTRTFGIPVRRSTCWTLSSPQGLEANFIQLKRTKYSRDNLTLIHERMCSISILFQVERRTGIPKVQLQIPLESTFFSWLWQCQTIMKELFLFFYEIFDCKGLVVLASTCSRYFPRVVDDWPDHSSRKRKYFCDVTEIIH